MLAVLLVTTENMRSLSKELGICRAGLMTLRRPAGLDRPQRALNAGPGHVDTAGVTFKYLATGGTGGRQTLAARIGRVLEALAAPGIDVLDVQLKSRSAKAGAKGLGSRGTPGLRAAAVYPSVCNDFYGARRLASAPAQQGRADATEVDQGTAKGMEGRMEQHCWADAGLLCLMGAGEWGGRARAQAKGKPDLEGSVTENLNVWVQSQRI